MEKAILVRVAAVMGFAVGLLLSLMQMDSRGEAPETFKLLVKPGIVMIIGGGLMVVSLVLFAISFLKLNSKFKKA